MIKKVNCGTASTYSTVKALREVCIRIFLENSQETMNLPNSFTGILDAFAPSSQMECEKIETLFIVMREKQQTLSALL